jgi:hypothetical protein
METLNTLFIPAMLENVEHGAVVGHLIVPEGMVKRETYEVAAWFRDHALIPGTYEVRYERYDGYPYHYLRTEVPSRIKAACLVPCFGGVQYGPDTAAEREVGKNSSYTMGRSLGYKLSTVDRGVSLEGCEFVPSV